MIRRLVTLVGWDLSLQLRSHFVTATALMAGFLCLVAVLLPYETLPSGWVVLLVFADPAVVGLTLVGGYVLMERGAQTLDALTVTPMPGWIYVSSKMLSFALLGTVSGLVVARVAVGSDLRWVAMTLSLVLANYASVAIGFALVARAPSINAFLVRILCLSVVMYLPLLVLFDVVDGLLELPMLLIPSYHMLALFEMSVVEGDPSMGTPLMSLGFLFILSLLGHLWGSAEYDRGNLKRGV